MSEDNALEQELYSVTWYMKSGAINAGLTETDNYEHGSLYVQH